MNDLSISGDVDGVEHGKDFPGKQLLVRINSDLYRAVSEYAFYSGKSKKEVVTDALEGMGVRSLALQAKAKWGET